MKGKTLPHPIMQIAALALLPVLFFSCSKEVSTTEPAQAEISGIIVVSSNPQGAKIFLNNSNTGKVTPDSILTLEAGNYSITLKSDTYLDTTFTVKLDAGKKVRIFCDYTTGAKNFGTIECVSIPANADIYLNDATTGKVTPYTFQFLKPGDYKVTFRIPQFREQSKIVTLGSGSIKKVELALQDTSVWVDYNPDNSTFPDFNVHSVAADDEDILWIGTKSKGLIKYSGGKTYTAYTYSNSAMKDAEVTMIRKDPRGRLWVLCPFSVVMIDHGVWNVYTTNNSGITIDNFIDVTFDSYNNPWFLRSKTYGDWVNEVITFDGTKWKIVIPKFRTSRCIKMDINNRLWLGTDGVIIFDSSKTYLDYTKTTGQFDKFPHMAVDTFNWINNKMYIGCTITSGITTLGGVYYSTDAKTFEQLSLPINSNISSIYQGRNENMWVTKGGKGYTTTFSTGSVVKVDAFGASKLYNSNSTGAIMNNCVDITTRVNGDVFVATIGGGLVKFKGGDKK